MPTDLYLVPAAGSSTLPIPASLQTQARIPDISGKFVPAGQLFPVASYSLGATNTPPLVTGGGGGASKVDISAVNLQRQVDPLSNTLFAYCAAGRTMDHADLLVVSVIGDGSAVTRLQYTFKHVFVDSVQWSGADEQPTEAVSLNFTAIIIRTRWQQPDGTSGPLQEVGWDLARNVAI